LLSRTVPSVHVCYVSVSIPNLPWDGKSRLTNLPVPPSNPHRIRSSIEFSRQKDPERPGSFPASPPFRPSPSMTFWIGTRRANLTQLRTPPHPRRCARYRQLKYQFKSVAHPLGKLEDSGCGFSFLSRLTHHPGFRTQTAHKRSAFIFAAT